MVDPAPAPKSNRASRQSTSQPKPAMPKQEPSPQAQARIAPSIQAGPFCVFRTVRGAFWHTSSSKNRAASADLGQPTALRGGQIAQNSQCFALTGQSIRGAGGRVAGPTSSWPAGRRS
jgi:hypothetical protein